MYKIGLLGAGTWGIAIARLLSNCGHDVLVWSALEDEIKELDSTRRQKNLPGVEIPQKIRFTADIEEVCKDKDILFFAVPSVFVRSTAKAAAPYIRRDQIIVDLAKGIEADSLLSMTEVIRSEMLRSVFIVALSGPTHAEEVANDIPTMIVSACQDLEIAETVQDVFKDSCLRVYTNPDIEGVELCGALKNAIALASGISDGMGYGDNTKAALITRGMAEIANLGKSMGCYEQTFSGLAGMGDLIVTSTSRHSRNNRCGHLIGQGIKPEEAIKEIGMVVEGINVLPAAINLAKRYRVKLPIIEAVNNIVNCGMSPEDAFKEFMDKDNNSEISSTINYEHVLLQKGNHTGMKRVITYGTYDLLHYGHINLLRRAKALGDYLIVVLSSDEFNWNEKHKKTYFTYEQRKQLLESIRYVDLVIPENSWQQKRSDVHEYHVDIFVMGDDWKGKFDFLKDEGVEVVYLPRTPEISSSQMKKDLHSDDNSDLESQINHDDIDTDPS